MLLPWLSLALAGPPEVPAPVASVVGRWDVDWSCSSGVDAMLEAQGVPRLMRALARRVSVRQEIMWSEGHVHLVRHLPIGKVADALPAEGSWQELSSRVGDHRARYVPDAAEFTVERAFPDYTMTEVWSLEKGTLISRRTLDYPDGRSLVSVVCMRAAQ